MARPISAVAAISVIAVPLCLPSLAAQPTPVSGGDSELKQNFAAEHEVGRRFHFDPADLPEPKSGPIVTDRSLIVPYGEQTLQVPEGFVAAPYVTGLANPRRLLVLPNGDVLVVEQSAGYVTLLRDDGRRPRQVDRPARRGPQQALWDRLAR
jgi:glucose/arabinose dehydrogenase